MHARMRDVCSHGRCSAQHATHNGQRATATLRRVIAWLRDRSVGDRPRALVVVHVSRVVDVHAIGHQQRLNRRHERSLCACDRLARVGAHAGRAVGIFGRTSANFVPDAHGQKSVSAMRPLQALMASVTALGLRVIRVKHAPAGAEALGCFAAVVVVRRTLRIRARYTAQCRRAWASAVQVIRTRRY
jgi:hypothetical protein